MLTRYLPTPAAAAVVVVKILQAICFESALILSASDATKISRNMHTYKSLFAIVTEDESPILGFIGRETSLRY
ncbi:uncharacterized protein P174DRAFT_417189 [Aspergillus novofumigatus IBT 16806]|uniref:Uncharacterized protein n=1 Tax=Aspergillus novofumigatus (strain IBT 16806) TaxID=1392255 RepID=A0A2I1CPI0_ASPN1|nr:uncharacterized protein P174DRAFT_417189 [Aspergillus novofumigatus IBT 16806]PKX99531.1 hypothetical protein P174DRAFT_417189 [Aspergillus novofumigatus IBT 16806]